MASEQRLEAIIRRVFLAWGVRDVNLRELAAAVARGDESRVLQLLGVAPETLSPILEELQGAFVDAGSVTLAALPRTIVGQAAFGLGNPRVTDYISRKSFELIQDITTEQRGIVRNLLEDVSQRGANPTTTVKQLIGVKGPTGQRTGSVLGLSWNQKEYVDNMRADLSDPATLHKYKTRERRDKNFDRTIDMAIREGRPLTAAEIDKATARYTDNLLKYRAETVARTEYKEATEAARQASMEMLVDQGQVDRQDVTAVWDATGDKKTRPSHDRAHLQRRPMGTPFEVGGYEMMFPGDTSLGAPAKETANCRCILRFEVDYYAALKRRKQREAALA